MPRPSKVSAWPTTRLPRYIQKSGCKAATASPCLLYALGHEAPKSCATSRGKNSHSTHRCFSPGLSTVCVAKKTKHTSQTRTTSSAVTTSATPSWGCREGPARPTSRRLTAPSRWTCTPTRTRAPRRRKSLRCESCGCIGCTCVVLRVVVIYVHQSSSVGHIHPKNSGQCCSRNKLLLGAGGAHDPPQIRIRTHVYNTYVCTLHSCHVGGGDDFSRGCPSILESLETQRLNRPQQQQYLDIQTRPLSNNHFS